MTDPSEEFYDRDFEVTEREADGWELVKGYPAVIEEDYVLDSFTYYASRVTRNAKVWRKAV